MQGIFPLYSLDSKLMFMTLIAYKYFYILGYRKVLLFFCFKACLLLKMEVLTTDNNYVQMCKCTYERRNPQQ